MGKRLDKARDFVRDAKKGDPDTIYFLYGEEGYLLDQAVDAVIDNAAPNGTDDFNFDNFRGRDVTGEKIREACEMLPMMADRRIVLVRDVQEMALAELDKLEDYFKDPAETTCLILHARTGGKNKIDGRKSIIRKLKKAATHCEFEALYDYEVTQVVQKHAKDQGMNLSQAASAYLIEAVGTDIDTLDRALEKIDLYVGPSEDGRTRRVGEDEVKEVTAETKVHSIFDLTDALGDRKFQECLKILDGMLLNGESPISIVFMIARHFRIVDKLHDSEVRSLGKRKRCKKLGILHWFIDDYQRHARKFSANEAAQIRYHLLEADQALKSTGLSDRTILESLLYDICFRDSADEKAAR